MRVILQNEVSKANYNIGKIIYNWPPFMKVVFYGNRAAFKTNKKMRKPVERKRRKTPSFDEVSYLMTLKRQ